LEDFKPPPIRVHQYIPLKPVSLSRICLTTLEGWGWTERYLLGPQIWN
jgi:hypothetical protein